MATGKASLRLRKQREGERISDASGDVALQSQHTREFAIEGRGPTLDLFRHLDQTDVYAKPLAFSANASLQQVLNAQLTTDLTGGCVAFLVAHRRGPRDDTEPLRLQLSEPRDHLVSQPVTEKVLLRIAHQVFEGEHGKLDRRRSGWGRQQSFANTRQGQR